MDDAMDDAMDEDAVAGCCSNSVRTSKRTKTLSYKAELNAKITARAANMPVHKSMLLTPSCTLKNFQPALLNLSREEEECSSSSTLNEDQNAPVQFHGDDDIYSILPGRTKQIKLLVKLLTGNSLPSCLYVHGSNSTGKTLTLSTVLSSLELVLAVINCRECYSSELLFTEIISTLSDLSDSTPRCSSFHNFLTIFKQLSCVSNRKSVCIVLDNADCLKGDSILLSALVKLAELSGSNVVCVILVSVVTKAEFFGNNLPLDVLSIHFPQYSKEEVLKIMLLDCPNSQSLTFYETFVNHVWNVFNTVCRDASELCHLCRILFPKYLEPVEMGDIGFRETHHLWKHIEPYFRTIMNRIYLREMSDLDGPLSFPSPLPELPFYSKYLLLASFLASYNSSRTDRQLFSKLKQSKARHKLQRHKAATEATGNQVGPSEFSMDRVMAIFHSITTVTAAQLPSTQLHCQMATLVSLQLLARSSKSEALDCPKYKCLMDLATAQHLAVNVGFDLFHHLPDFDV